MITQITIQMAEIKRNELLAEAAAHRTARSRTRITARLLAATPLRRNRSNADVDLDAAVACCTAAA
ncbi:MAG TPA: hypothetical protein VEA78_07620 [Acidimicrobiales bacterium]|nr:hypothetical protein [Acidimicrobiales bacterium]